MDGQDPEKKQDETQNGTSQVKNNGFKYYGNIGGTTGVGGAWTKRGLCRPEAKSVVLRGILEFVSLQRRLLLRFSFLVGKISCD